MDSDFKAVCGIDKHTAYKEIMRTWVKVPEAAKEVIEMNREMRLQMKQPKQSAQGE